MRIEIEPEHTLAFYAPAPGELVMVESLNRVERPEQRLSVVVHIVRLHRHTV